VTSRTLDVYIDQVRVGSLHEGNDIWSFSYDPSWTQRADAYDLAPALPRAQGTVTDGASLRPVQWYFDNLLPEELLRQAIARDVGLPADDAFALLAYLGAESAGSPTLLSPRTLPPTEFGWQPLPDAEISRRIAALPRQPLSHDSPKRMSIAGAQHKLMVTVVAGRLHEPVGAAASSHILKPDHPDSLAYPASTLNETIIMRLASAAGLAVPEVELRRVPEPVYLIRRFDRLMRASAPAGGAVKVDRLHIIDGCQLLNKARGFKYTGASLASLKAVIELCANKAATRQALFRWLVFNLIVGNDDCHLKNLSFFVTPGGIALAPHYDLLSTAAYQTRAIAGDSSRWPTIGLPYPLPRADTFADVSPHGVLEAAALLGLPQTTAARLLATMVRKIEAAWPVLVREHASSLQALAAAGPAAANETRLLRVIEHGVLREMLGRLK
jgi:serine/threonine-protein kinase HipA